MALTEVILVDERDRAVGTMEKLQAHREGALHRAVTVYLFNPDGQLLLQQRAREKYHCGGLWSNTCCGHPMPAEESAAAARRRLYEEMGMRVALTPVLQLRYRLPLPNGLIEHEYGHVFFGVTPLAPTPDPDEAMAWRWQTMPSVVAQLASEPEVFTPWFRLTMEKIPAQYAAFLRARQAS
ncbi:Isopentenyl-diphosphate delta-isomerase [Sodalis praecaptivus]|uniref:Isopentenyl-diphosphate Delta-isomerase n=1 Tax=Sodalis praecaptivus TaxID=1239307 RepID=K7SQK4_9GAMM|nr:isopentenyl-diphosphate Delta-isomerase [Sodalis praecaptivus]AFW03746.1 isopentenyl-diphosphate delta-isomerase [Sodalis praecaptivus]AHF77728.1 Isopentenyl-diphosphate delta-isomerase [Sodalis praecaptivus]